MRTTIEKEFAGQKFEVEIREHTGGAYGMPYRKIKIWRKSNNSIIHKDEVEVNDPSWIDRKLFGIEHIEELPPRDEHVERAFKDVVGGWAKKKLEERKAENQFKAGLDNIDDSGRRSSAWSLDNKHITLDISKQEVGKLLYGETVTRGEEDPTIELKPEFDRNG